jgi:capsular polysaccharide biosynthesis protein
MRDRGGGRWGVLLLLLVISARLYDALLGLYPRAFRRRYGAEMRRDFRELSREGLEEGGVTELARVLAEALPDLALTALEERSTMLAKSSRSLSVDPRMVARAMVAAVLVVVGAAVGASLLQQPTYQASALSLVGQERENGHGPNPQKSEPQSNLAQSGEEIQTLPPPGRRRELQALTQTMIIATDTRSVAEETILRLGLDMSPGELLSNLAIEQVENTQFIQLTYTDTNPGRAEEVVNTVGQVAVERISNTSAATNDLKATVYERAITPDSPVSPKPLRNGLIALVVGLVLCAGTALALPAVGTRVAGTLGERPSRQGVGQAGVLGRRHRDYSIVERIKEKKLLRALGRRGKLTAVEAAIVTSLSVEEANRILSELAHNGHLEVTVEHGKLLYSFWEHDAP